MSALTLYGDNATYGSPYVYAIDPSTGHVTQTYTNLSSLNGRGSVVVSNTLYYTTANSPSIYAYNLNTHTDMGAVFSVSGAVALSTIAYDGTNFWIGDYSGTNQAYQYSTTGTLLKTVHLTDCGGNCDGLEYFVDSHGNARLISNEGDGESPATYDVYDTNGNLITHNFINTGSASGTGIAFNGTDFYVSNIYEGTIGVYDTSGTLVKSLTLTGFPSSNMPLVEDLSFDYTSVLPPPPPPPGNVPEPASLGLIGAGVAGAWAMSKRRMRS